VETFFVPACWLRRRVALRARLLAGGLRTGALPIISRQSGRPVCRLWRLLVVKTPWQFNPLAAFVVIELTCAAASHGADRQGGVLAPVSGIICLVCGGSVLIGQSMMFSLESAVRSLSLRLSAWNLT
jgi:hypothetical protein